MTRILIAVLMMLGVSARTQERSIPIVVQQPGAQSPVLIVGAACVVAAAGFGVGWVIGRVVNACLGTNAPPAQAQVFGPASVTGCPCGYSISGTPLPLQLEWHTGTQWLPMSQEGLVTGSQYEIPENGQVRARVLPIGIQDSAGGALLDVPPGDLLESSDLVSWTVAGRYFYRTTVGAESGKFYRMKL